jgi:hypothetical protein
VRNVFRHKGKCVILVACLLAGLTVASMVTGKGFAAGLVTTTAPAQCVDAPGQLCWTNQGSDSLLDCSDNQSPFIHWVFTPGGGDNTISKATLIASGTVSGSFEMSQNGNGSWAVDTPYSGSGPPDSSTLTAYVQYTGSLGQGNSNLVISHGCYGTSTTTTSTTGTTGTTETTSTSTTGTTQTTTTQTTTTETTTTPAMRKVYVTKECKDANGAKLNGCPSGVFQFTVECPLGQNKQQGTYTNDPLLLGSCKTTDGGQVCELQPPSSWKNDGADCVAFGPGENDVTVHFVNQEAAPPSTTTNVTNTTTTNVTNTTTTNVTNTTTTNLTNTTATNTVTNTVTATTPAPPPSTVTATVTVTTQSPPAAPVTNTTTVVKTVPGKAVKPSKKCYKMVVKHGKRVKVQVACHVSKPPKRAHFTPRWLAQNRFNRR